MRGALFESVQLISRRSVVVSAVAPKHISNPLLPASGIALEMVECDDRDRVTFETVVNTVRKTPDHRPTDPWHHLSVGLRQEPDSMRASSTHRNSRRPRPGLCRSYHSFASA